MALFADGLLLFLDLEDDLQGHYILHKTFQNNFKRKYLYCSLK